MKYQWLLSMIVFFTTSCSSQNKINMLKNINYYTVATNGRVAEIKISNDSLSVIYKKENTVVKEDLYKVVEEEKKEKYWIVYIDRSKPDPEKANQTPDSELPYGVFIFSFEDKDKLLVLHENRLWYKSIIEAKNAVAATHYEDKHFLTWYAEADFKAFNKFPDLKNADKDEVQKVVYELIGRMNHNKDNKKNTQRADFYGTGFMQDNLTEVLINNHFNPLLSITDLDKLAEELHIIIPQIRRDNTNQPQLKSKARDPNTVIDQPKQ
jgi:hypothetical protein